MHEFTSNYAQKIKEYLELREAVGFSEDHKKHLIRFDQYCKEHHPKATELNEEVVHGWFSNEIFLGRRGLANKASAIRLFAMFAGEEAYILPRECVPKQPGYIPYIMTQDELRTFFSAVDNFHREKDPFFGDTIQVLFRLLYCCGLRPGESRRLNTEDINFISGEIFIRRSKRNKDRIVVASDDMLQLLSEYHKKRCVVPSESKAFFVHSFGKPLEIYDLISVMHKCWQNANPDITPELLPRLRPYDLRHLYASTILQKWLDEGRNLYAMLPYLRAYMGHKRFEDTAYYIHILPERLMNSPGVDWDYIDSIGLEVGIWQN